MNDSPVAGNGGVTIKPLPRKSIHIHCGGCPFLFNEKMVRYGVNSHKTRHQHRQNLDNQSPQGNDEVDNAMSKFAYTSSPVLERRNDYLRRNSVDIPNDKYSSDSDDDIKLLSKSSPAFFSSLHCSDESYSSANQNGQDVSHNISGSTTYASSYPVNRYNTRENDIIYQSQDDSRIQPVQSLHSKSENSILTYTLFILILVIAAGAAYYKDYFNTTVEIRNNVYDKFSFYNDVKNLGEKYKVNDNSLLQIKTGVATIFEKQDTGSFIFVYNSKTNRFNVLVFDDFMKEISSTTARYLRNETVTGHHVVVDTSTVKTDTELMNRYRHEVGETGVMLVKDVHNIPSQLAMAFHYYCDEYDPLVKRSAIFFTLNLASCTNASDNKSSHEIIEKCLATKWHSVEEDKIGPLLTRIVNIVVDVTSIF